MADNLLLHASGRRGLAHNQVDALHQLLAAAARARGQLAYRDPPYVVLGQVLADCQVANDREPRVFQPARVSDEPDDVERRLLHLGDCQSVGHGGLWENQRFQLRLDSNGDREMCVRLLSSPSLTQPALLFLYQMPRY